MYTYLKTIRNENKYTVQKMADMLGISKSFYSQLENGIRKLSYDMAVNISAIFNMKPDSVFYENHINNKKEKTS